MKIKPEMWLYVSASVVTQKNTCSYHASLTPWTLYLKYMHQQVVWKVLLMKVFFMMFQDFSPERRKNNKRDCVSAHISRTEEKKLLLGSPEEICREKNRVNIQALIDINSGHGSNDSHTSSNYILPVTWLLTTCMIDKWLCCCSSFTSITGLLHFHHHLCKITVYRSAP